MLNKNNNPTTDYAQQANDIAQKLTAGALQFSKADPNAFVGTNPSTIPTYTPDTSTNDLTPVTQYSNLNTAIKNLGTVTTGYGDTTKYEKFHPGIDIANKIGTPIPSFSDGVVEKIEHNPSGFGNSVIIKDGQGNELRYSHLKQAYVQVGEKLNKGAEVGLMGNTGSTYSNSGGTGSHLDLRIMNAYKKYINPFTYLGQNQNS